MVGNSSHLHCQGICHDVAINLQDIMFFLPFYLFPIVGTDVVLGMEWLRTLGPLQADFCIPSISFSHGNQTITLQGDPPTSPTHTTLHQFCQLLHQDSIASLHLLTILPTSPNTIVPENFSKSLTTPKSTPPSVQKIIQTYHTVFHEPQGLPPIRPHDHRIPLLPNTSPINVRPYRYPHA